jgi:hypothetical protein
MHTYKIPFRFMYSVRNENKVGDRFFQEFLVNFIIASHLNYLCFFIASEVGLSPLYCGHFWPIVPAPDDRWGWLWSKWWNEDWQRKPRYSEKTCHSATLSTTNPTWPDPGSNPGRRGGKPMTNRLSYGAGYLYFFIRKDASVLIE